MRTQNGTPTTSKSASDQASPRPGKLFAAYLESRGSTGCTGDEVATALDLDKSSCSNARTAMLRKGKAMLTGGTRLTACGKQAQVVVDTRFASEEHRAITARYLAEAPGKAARDSQCKRAQEIADLLEECLEPTSPNGYSRRALVERALSKAKSLARSLA